MKKFLAVFLAALMMFTTFGVLSYAGEPVVQDEALTLDEVLDIAASYEDTEGMIPTVLVFNTASAKMGTVPRGKMYYITSGRNKGSYALIDENFVIGEFVQLPYIKDAGEDMTANWLLQTGIEGVPSGTTFAQGSMFEIPKGIAGLPQGSNYITFYANIVPAEKSSVLAKVFTVFYKILKVIFGDEFAYKFAELLYQFGVVIEK